MHDESRPGFTKLKYHVLVTTYETVTNSRDFGAVFKQAPRWEALIVDEGQRRMCLITVSNLYSLTRDLVKNDNSLIFKKLTELNSSHRIIMTGVGLTQF